MRVLLIQPRCADAVDVEYVSLQFPLNLGYVAAALRAAGHDVRLVDFNVQPARLLGGLLGDFRPGLVGITSMTAAFPHAAQVAAAVRRALPASAIVLGGAHGTALPERTLREVPALDAVVVGEGEQTAVELAAAVAAGGAPRDLSGLVWRANGSVAAGAPRPFLADLDRLPFPARDLVPLALYNRQHASRGFPRNRYRIAELVTSRGCPYRCIFCASHLCTGRTLRARSPENVIAEVDDCIARFGVNHFSIEDDAFSFHRANAYALCEAFAQRRVTWNCNARVDNVDREFLRAAARSGCLKVSFGVESGSPRILKKTRKGITVEQVREAVHAARESGIRFVECTFLLGAHPDETPEDVTHTQRLIDELGPDLASVCVTCPYPGTEYARIMEERGLMDPETPWSEYVLFGDVRPYRRLPHFTRARLWDLQRSMVRRYYGSPRYVLRQLGRLRGLGEAAYFARLGWLFLREFVVREAGRALGRLGGRVGGRRAGRRAGDDA